MSRDIYKDFKKQFYIAKKAVSAMSETKIDFKMKYDKNRGLQPSSSMPPEKEVARFACAVFSFANPDSDLNLRKIVERLANDFDTELSEEKKSTLNKDIQSIESGPLQMRVEGDKPLRGLELYLEYAKGEYFSNEEESRSKIDKLKSNTVTSELMLFHFHSYSYEVYKLSRYIFDLIRKAERLKKTDVKTATKQSENSKCIYCLRDDATFKSEEHVYPESLGNTEIILPPGHVCDECNNGVLSRLDSHLVNHDMISFLKILYLQYNPKTGKFPKAKYQNMTIEKIHPRKISIEEHDEFGDGFQVEDLGDVSKIKVKATGREPFNPQQLGRSLFKVALGIICWQNGVKVVLDKKYDLARNYILGERTSFPGSLAICSHCTPQPTIEGAHILGCKGTPFVINIFGIFFIFNLEPGPLDHDQLIKNAPPELKGFDFKSHSLS